MFCPSALLYQLSWRLGRLISLCCVPVQSAFIPDASKLVSLVSCILTQLLNLSFYPVLRETKWTPLSRCHFDKLPHASPLIEYQTNSSTALSWSVTQSQSDPDIFTTLIFLLALGMMAVPSLEGMAACSSVCWWQIGVQAVGSLLRW